jgi:RimJ/RimL family protein N-acetyltransferase
MPADRRDPQRKVFRTSDGQPVVVRQPDPSADLDRIVAFFRGLPSSIRNYMRHGAEDRDFAASRLAQIDNRAHWRLVAEIDGDIVADCTLDREPFTWSRHVAEIRPILTPEAQRLGVGTLLCREVVELGRAAGVERLFTEVMPEQTDLIRVLEAEGFAWEATRRAYAKDADGRLHDIVLLSSNLEDIWLRLQDEIEHLDHMHQHSGRY